MTWEPSASIKNLQQRALVLQQIREFFAKRQVLEVETPLLSQGTVTDLYIDSIAVAMYGKTYYLQTSPEYAMKRLLAAGSGSIYQITKAFRQDQSGRIHNPEFTMLEWYRVGFDHQALMDEMDELLQWILATAPAQRFTYREIFLRYLAMDPHAVSDEELWQCVKQRIELASEITDRDTWLDLLFVNCIEPNIGREQPVFIYDFPATKAALAKIRLDNPPVASRFEVYFHGMELANGFHELQDGNEQGERFERDLQLREQQGKTIIPIDQRFLAALTHGLPDCAGVALGIDRLVMLAAQSTAISEVVSFDFARA